MGGRLNQPSANPEPAQLQTSAKPVPSQRQLNQPAEQNPSAKPQLGPKRQDAGRAGRPVRDAATTQQQILNAAEQEFSRHGLRGARMSAIARQAQVTTATLHYYFENKESLYKAVLQRPVDQVQAQLGQLSFAGLSPEAALTQIVRLAIANEAQNPQRQMLWFQEASQNQGVYFKDCNVMGLHQHLLQILEQGMAEGIFRPIPPFLALTHILSVCLFYFTVHENWKHLTPEVNRLSPEMIQAHTEAAIAFILAGVRQAPEQAHD